MAQRKSSTYISSVIIKYRILYTYILGLNFTKEIDCSSFSLNSFIIDKIRVKNINLYGGDVKILPYLVKTYSSTTFIKSGIVFENDVL
jgi:hypothetical protein